MLLSCSELDMRNTIHLFMVRDSCENIISSAHDAGDSSDIVTQCYDLMDVHGVHKSDKSHAAALMAHWKLGDFAAASEVFTRMHQEGVDVLDSSLNLDCNVLTELQSYQGEQSPTTATVNGQDNDIVH